MSRISTLATALALALTMQVQAHAQTATTPAADQGAAARADTGTISGVVSDAGRGGYLAGAEVRISGLNVVAVSASDGSFTLHRVPAGRHELTVSYIGRPDRQQAVDVTGGQTTQAAVAVGMGNDATTLDEIVVRAAPIAESEYAALQAQRASVSLVNVIAADSIGRFPDQNVAASLSRLPGIADERDQGQERYVNLRGAPARDHHRVRRLQRDQPGRPHRAPGHHSSRSRRRSWRASDHRGHASETLPATSTSSPAAPSTTKA